MEYKVLEMDFPRVLRHKPRWATCLAFTTALLVITLSAITMGMFLGYTYCYVEHRTGVSSGNITQSTNLQIVQMPFLNTAEAKQNRTNNGSSISSIMLSRILNIGRALIEDDFECIPLPGEDRIK